MYARVKASGRLIKLCPHPISTKDENGDTIYQWMEFYTHDGMSRKFYDPADLHIYPDSWIRYEDYCKLEDARRDAEERKAWTAFRTLDDQIEAARVIPEVNTPGTVIYYTDYCSGYVAEIISPTEIRFVETGIYSGEMIFTLRKSGHWVKKGHPLSDGVRLALGWKHDYRCEEI